jgi:hypothetical protein
MEGKMMRSVGCLLLLCWMLFTLLNRH